MSISTFSFSSRRLGFGLKSFRIPAALIMRDVTGRHLAQGRLRLLILSAPRGGFHGGFCRNYDWFGPSSWVEIAGMGKSFVLAPQQWEFAPMGRPTEMALAFEGWFLLVAAVDDGGNPSVQGRCRGLVRWISCLFYFYSGFASTNLVRA